MKPRHKTTHPSSLGPLTDHRHWLQRYGTPQTRPSVSLVGGRPQALQRDLVARKSARRLDLTKVLSKSLDSLNIINAPRSTSKAMLARVTAVLDHRS